ncbi:MAG TPA: carboxypeptidase-like regulatory domain-containing protein, partial [Mucilaginibacter sp.]
MKLAVIFFITICLNASAKIYAQKLSLNESNASLQTVFKKITKQTNYRFLYTRELLKKSNKVSINLADESLEDALKQIFADQPITYLVYDKVVIIKDKVNTLGAKPVIAKTITGKVVDDLGAPLPGVTVNEKGSRNTVATDVNGNYKITVSDEQATLVFSFVGFKPQEVQPGSNTIVNVQLKANLSALNEVVVVGYGTQKRSDITGSV